jgi:hypothetical protein
MLREPVSEVDQSATLAAKGPPLGFRPPGDRNTAVWAGDGFGHGGRFEEGGYIEPFLLTNGWYYDNW